MKNTVDNAPGDPTLYSPPFGAFSEGSRGDLPGPPWPSLLNALVIFHTLLEATVISSSGVSAVPRIVTPAVMET